ncbi:MAG TPA: hypothetical protein VF533_11935 [Solirubrobacteraceae bacterium]|jgi:hypothetical protein
MNFAAVAAGIGLVVVGVAVLRFNRRLGKALAASNRAGHDPRYSLLNRERAERVRDAESDPTANRFSAIVLGAGLTAMGVYSIGRGLGIG